MSDEDRLAYHQQHSGPVMDALKDWLHEQFDEKKVEPNSALAWIIHEIQHVTAFGRSRAINT